MSIKSHATTRVIDQFHHPRGFYGRIAGRIMTTRDTNVARNQWVAEILHPDPGDRILEIGHGPGLAIAALVPCLRGGHLTGLEISELMSRSAARRNRRAVSAGVVDFRVGDSGCPPTDLDGFDMIYAVNATMFWTEPAVAIAELGSRLAPGGEMVFVYMPPPTSTMSAEDFAADTGGHFAATGLTNVSHERFDHQPAAIATRGRRVG